MENFDTIGLRFYKYMKTKGLGVNEVARLVEMSGSQISNIKNGKVFGTDKMYKILNIFSDLDANWLFRGTHLDPSSHSINQLDYMIELQKERIIDLKKENAELKRELQELREKQLNL
ncbi:helix-turn-helix domain-containing protein [Flavobacterium sp.]|uniref:helix-turn-helix domain-containing protein n=1 Tax=Flavobacterium sp. TaxID=239 RepID=UPI003D100364